MIKCAKWLAWFSGVVSCLVLIGYTFHILPLIKVLPTLRGMSPLTALGLLAVSATMSFEPLAARSARTALGMVAQCLGATGLLVRALWGRDALSATVAFRLFGVESRDAGSMSMATAICLIMLGTSAVSRQARFVPDGMAAVAFAISSVSLLGYSYGVHDLYAVPIFDSMALHTAAVVFALSLASIAGRPNSAWSAAVASESGGGVATRRQLAFAIFPPLVGWLLVSALDNHKIGPAAAMALLVTFVILPLLGLILRNGETLCELERERHAKDALGQTYAKDLEDQLARQAEILTEQSAERHRAESAVARIQRMDAIGQLTGGISHDFNNLLMVIGGNLQLISRCLPRDHQVGRYVDNAITAAERGKKLTGQLLAFSRIQKLENKNVPIDEVLRNARQLVGNALGPSIAFELDLKSAGKLAFIDPDQLELAILNLAVNARDAMPTGGRLTIESSVTHRVCDQSDSDGYCLNIKVIDTGRGMAPNVVARAVEPFFTTKEPGKGTGLGLSQVYGFVSQSSGDVRIASCEGRGTIIEIILPIAEPTNLLDLTAASGERAAPVREHLGGRKLVLVIDDDDDVRTVLVEALRDVGYKVIEARDGQAGLDYLKTMRPAAAIIDFLMPGLNGAETARLAQIAQPELQIIFVSGYYDTAALSASSGAVVLKKPFELSVLHETIASVIH